MMGQVGVVFETQPLKKKKSVSLSYKNKPLMKKLSNYNLSYWTQICFGSSCTFFL